jgi:hypothetical protein
MPAAANKSSGKKQSIAFLFNFSPHAPVPLLSLKIQLNKLNLNGWDYF